jgi:hypothetical protein
MDVHPPTETLVSSAGRRKGKAVREGFMSLTSLRTSKLAVQNLKRVVLETTFHGVREPPFNVAIVPLVVVVHQGVGARESCE